MVAPLRLRSEKVGRPEEADSDPVLSILVDTGVYHLDGEYDYLLPKQIVANVGDWVSIPFKGKNTLGLIVRRSKTSNIAKLNFINRLAKGPRLSKELIEIYQEIASHWAVPIFDVLRFVIRTQVDFMSASNTNLSSNRNPKRSYYQLSPSLDEISQVKRIANKLADEGPTLVIVPEANTLELLKSDRYQVAMRSGILTPSMYRNILILREDSEHHYEIKSPGFNTRDVALIRSKKLGENLLFVGFSPSLEMFQMIERKYVALKQNPGKTKIEARPSIQGELIPSALISSFKDSLKQGPVLVVAPRKGYGRAISCARCRNIALCNCGGRLTKLSKLSNLSCLICSKRYEDWRCTHCSAKEIRIVGKGIDRIAEEFGRTFANTEIHISTAEKRIEGTIGKRAIVLATMGSAPIQLYSNVLFLEGLNLTSDIRSEERAVSDYFRYTALSQGKALIVERPESPLVNALFKWNPFSVLTKNLNEIRRANLPPFRRQILLKTELKESARIYTGLLSAMSAGRLPDTVSIYSRESGLISIFFDSIYSKEVLGFIREFQRKRSMSGKALIKLRVDSYLLG